MKTLTFTLMLMLSAVSGFSTTWTVTTPGFEFSPATITIPFGDTVNFDIGSIHTVLEVSQQTWDANGTTPLAGGFSLPLGGGTLLPEDLSIGVHYYVCEPHASMGMKGVIIVEGVSGADDPSLIVDISVYPNPSNGKFHLITSGAAIGEPFDLEVYDAQGKIVYSQSGLDPRVNNEIDLSKFEKGVYLLKVYAGIRLYNSKVVIE